MNKSKVDNKSVGKHKHKFNAFEGICSVKGCDVNRTTAQIEEAQISHVEISPKSYGNPTKLENGEDKTVEKKEEILKAQCRGVRDDCHCHPAVAGHCSNCREDFCPLSKRIDGKIHSLIFDGDDPYTICVYCGEVRDAISGRIIKLGRTI